MSGHRSKVKRPMAAPDGTFLLLEKDGVEKQGKFTMRYIDREMYSKFGFGQVKGEHVQLVMGQTLKNEKSC